MSRLYGLGLGPGDPELITLKAWRILSTVPVIAWLTANGKDSTARDIARPFIPDDVTELAIDMPMSLERHPAQAAYDSGAVRIRQHLEQGRDVAILCEGDPFFYGSFMYFFQRLARDFETIVIPGVTSLTASAAAMGRPLSGRSDVVKVLPATMAEDHLAREVATADSIALIKVGRHVPKVRRVLGELGLMARATAVIHATRDDERIVPFDQIGDDSLPYFSTILIYKGGESW